MIYNESLESITCYTCLVGGVQINETKNPPENADQWYILRRTMLKQAPKFLASSYQPSRPVRDATQSPGKSAIFRDDIKSSEKISILNQFKIGGGGGPAGCQV